jgi:hypothetical protein
MATKNGTMAVRGVATSFSTAAACRILGRPACIQFGRSSVRQRSLGNAERDQPNRSGEQRVVTGARTRRSGGRAQGRPPAGRNYPVGRHRDPRGRVDPLVPPAIQRRIVMPDDAIRRFAQVRQARLCGAITLNDQGVPHAVPSTRPANAPPFRPAACPVRQGWLGGVPAARCGGPILAQTSLRRSQPPRDASRRNAPHRVRLRAIRRLASSRVVATGAVYGTEGREFESLRARSPKPR